MKALTPLALLLAGLLALPAHAGLELVESDGSTRLIADGRMKTVPPEAEGPIHILDTRSGTVTVILPAKGAYAQGTPEAFCQAVKALRDKALTGLSQPERQMLERYKDLRGADGRPEVRVEHREAGEAILAYPTEHYAVYVDDALYEEVWISDARALMAEVGDQEALVNLSTRVATCLASGPGMPPDPEGTPPYLALMKKGLVLKRADHTGGDPETVAARRVRIRRLGDETFRVPAGYRQLTLEQVLPRALEQAP